MSKQIRYRGPSRMSIWAVSTVLAFAMTSGCSSWKAPSWKPRGFGLFSWIDLPNGVVPWKDKEPRKGTPTRIASTWTDTVMQTPGEPARRGFGGRLYFYDSKSSDPIRVEGQVVVYAFDESNRTPTDNAPTKKYVFRAEDLKLRESESEIGVSYSFWLPWDQMLQGPQTDVSLITRFEPLEGGTMLVSEQSQHRLPGKLTEGPDGGAQQLAASAPNTSVMQASFTPASATPTADSSSEAPQVDVPMSASRLKTTTISLPPGKRLGAGASTTTPATSGQPLSQSRGFELPVSPTAETKVSVGQVDQGNVGSPGQTSESLVKNMMGIPETPDSGSGVSITYKTRGETIRRQLGTSQPSGFARSQFPAQSSAASRLKAADYGSRLSQ